MSPVAAKKAHEAPGQQTTRKRPRSLPPEALILESGRFLSAQSRFVQRRAKMFSPLARVWEARGAQVPVPHTLKEIPDGPRNACSSCAKAHFFCR
jgi:hypothetical protein